MKLELKHIAPYLPYGLETDKGYFWAVCRDNLVKVRVEDKGIIKFKLE